MPDFCENLKIVWHLTNRCPASADNLKTRGEASARRMALDEAPAMTENKQPLPEDNPDESGWVDCPSGEISGMLDRLARQRKLAGAGKLSSVVAAVLIGAGIWLSFPNNPKQPADVKHAQSSDGHEFGEICCSDVSQYAAAFIKGELDEKKTAQISQHISECPHCGPEFEKLAAEPQASTGLLSGQKDSAILAVQAF